MGNRQNKKLTQKQQYTLELIRELAKLFTSIASFLVALTAFLTLIIKLF
ncbi:MAG: hypothetical protein AB9856_01600 [Cellulosilyticaceae bacterium]